MLYTSSIRAAQRPSLLSYGTKAVMSPRTDRAWPDGCLPEMLTPHTCWGTLEGSPQLAPCWEQKAPPDLQGTHCRSKNTQFLLINNQNLPNSCHFPLITTLPVIGKLLNVACPVPRQKDRLSPPSPSSWVQVVPPSRLTNVHRGVVSLDVFI